MYVTLLSNTSKPEFPHNTPASFKVRLPYPLRVKNWQVGVAGMYLPETLLPKPPEVFDINRLIAGGSAPYLFRLRVDAMVNGKKKLLQSTVKQQDARFGTTGVRWMERVVNKLEQDIFIEMGAGDTLEYDNGRGMDMPTFRWEGTDLVLDGSKVKDRYDGADYRVGVDALLAQKLHWLVANPDRTYSLGPRLLRQFPRYPLPSNQVWEYGFMVVGTVLFLAPVYTWRFVQLNDAFDEVTRPSFSPGPQHWLCPMHLYCNVGESSIVGTQITNFLRDLPYKGELTWREPEHVQYHRVRGDTVEIIEVQLAQKDGSLAKFNPAGETQVTLHFQA